MDSYIGAELERWWKRLPYPTALYSDEVKSIVYAELMIMLVEGIILFLFMKWSWLRTHPFRSLSFVNALGISMVANTVSALMPLLVDHLMKVSTFEYVKKYLLSP